MTRVDIQPMHQQIEAAESQKMILQWNEACRGKSGPIAREWLTTACAENAKEVIEKWHELGNQLIAKYKEEYS